MHPVLARNLFFVKEHVGMFKAANNYDVLDPESQAELIHCREPKLGFFTKLLRFTDYKRMTPFNVVLTTPDGEPILRVERGVSFFVSKVKVYDNSRPNGIWVVDPHVIVATAAAMIGSVHVDRGDGKPLHGKGLHGKGLEGATDDAYNVVFWRQ